MLFGRCLEAHMKVMFFEMRKASGAKYHKQIKFIHNHREEIRAKTLLLRF